MRHNDIRGPRPLTVLMAALIAFGAFGAAGTADYADALAEEAGAKVLLPELARERTEYERCQKVNAAGEWLRSEQAFRSDTKPHWQIDCRYTEFES